MIPLGADRCVYTFVLTPPPVPLEAIEGAMDEQSRTLAEELTRLKKLLAASGRSHTPGGFRAAVDPATIDAALDPGGPARDGDVP